MGKVIKEENFDCWDENTAWLYTDGDILFGREAVESEHKAYVPFPLIDWSKDTQAKYFTLFNPIHIPEQCSEQKMFQAIQEKWNEQEISFKESEFSSTDEVKQYLYNMMNLEYSRYNDQIGTYIILQNDKLL